LGGHTHHTIGSVAYTNVKLHFDFACSQPHSDVCVWVQVDAGLERVHR